MSSSDFPRVKIRDLGKAGRPVIKAGPFGSSITKASYVKSGYKVYGQEQVVAGDHDIGDYYISSEQFLELESCSVEEGDLLLSVMGTVGKALVIPKVFKTGVINPRLLRLSFDQKRVISEYIKYFFESPATVRKLERQSQGGTMGGLNAEIVGKIEVPVPTIKEQHQIVKFLLLNDRQIKIADGLTTLAKTKRQGLMQQLLTGKRRFSGFTKPWTQVRLGDIFTNRTENCQSGLPLLSITGDGGVVPRDEERKDTSNEDKSKYLRICPGDIGYNTMRMWQGVCGLSKHEGIVSPAYTIVTPRPQIDGLFASILFKFPPLINQFRRHSQGLVDDTLNLKFHHFSEIKFTIPPVEEQRVIAQAFAKADAEISALEKLLVAYRTQKKGLMQQLLTGKRRVKVQAA